MSSPAEVSVFQITFADLAASQDVQREDLTHIAEEVEDRTNLPLGEWSVEGFNWKKDISLLERRAESEDGWYLRDTGSGESFRWMPRDRDGGLLDKIQYYTRRARIQRDHRNMHGLFKSPYTVYLNTELFEHLSETTGHSSEAYRDSAALEELSHLVFNQNFDIDRTDGYSDPSRKREEALVDELADGVFQEMYGFPRRELLRTSTPYHEQILASLDEVISDYRENMADELNPRESYRGDPEIPEEVYIDELNPEEAERWINEGEI